jgi:hypothetical protein
LKPINHGILDAKPPTPSPAPVFSSQKSLMDYISIKGISERIGVEKDDLIRFILKELLDNALDFMETYGHNQDKTETKEQGGDLAVSVSITNEKITVSNCNFGIETFTRERLKSIFSFDRFYSSKRNIYRISRGSIGDALKEVICIPYALAADKGIEDWNQPVIITGNITQYLVYLKVDRVEQTLNVDIEEADLQSEREYTSIDVSLPPEAIASEFGLHQFLIQYAMLNSHISFQLEFDTDMFHQKYVLPRTQKYNREWANRPSIHYYRLEEFKQLIHGMEDNEAIAYDMFISLNFREVTNLSKSDTGMTIRELKEDTRKISQLYHKLRLTMSGNSRLRTQFDTNRQIRSQAIKKRVEDLGYVVSDFKYRLVHDYCNNGEIQFPVIFEIAVLQIENASKSTPLSIISGVNSSFRYISPFNGKYLGTYNWSTRNKEHEASSVNEILEKYGYSNSKEKSKKPPSFIFLNLISPRIDYEDYAKTHLNLRPFASTIAHSLYKICSRNGPGANNDRDSEKISARDILIEVLQERWIAVQKNPDSKRIDKWTQSTVYYRTRKKMMDRRMEPVTRKYITEMIREVCREKWGLTREGLGVFAADRAQLYFRGKVYDVGIEELPNLMKKGTDLLIIEKEGVAEVLVPYAANYGIAILNTRGFLTDYAEKLTELSEHVAILSDFDDSGLLLARDIRNIPRIGIDFETINYDFRPKLKRENVEEDYDKPLDKRNHFTNLRDLAEEGHLDPKIEQVLPYIRDKRIEIDSVLAEVGNERFWNFCLDKLKGLWKNRNYNRAISIAQDVVPEQIEEFIEDLKEKCNEVTAYRRIEIKAALEDIEGFIGDIDSTEDGVEVQMREVLSEDGDIQSLVTKVEELKEKLNQNENPNSTSED